MTTNDYGTTMRQLHAAAESYDAANAAQDRATSGLVAAIATAELEEQEPGCQECDGTGEVPACRDVVGFCPSCHGTGTGRKPPYSCPRCGAVGGTPETLGSGATDSATDYTDSEQGCSLCLEVANA